MRCKIRVLLAAAIALFGAAAQAGSVEDGFKAYLDKLRASGKSVVQSLPGNGLAAEIAKPELTKRVDTLPLGQSRYVLFVANGCRSCASVTDRVRKRTKGSVEVLNISTSTTAREAYILTQAKGVPAMLMGGYVMSGYSDKLYDRAMTEDLNDRMRGMQGQGN